MIPSTDSSLNLVLGSAGGGGGGVSISATISPSNSKQTDF